MKIKIPEYIKNLMPYQPGKPIEEVRREYNLKGEIFKLASNENPYGPSELAKEVIEKNISNINEYPDGSCFILKKALSEHLGVDMDHIIVGAGSDELIGLICLSFLEPPNDEIVTGFPAFIRYYQNASALNIKTNFVKLVDYKYDLNSVLENITEKTKIIFIDNPTNPCGSYLKSNEIKEFTDKVPDNILIVFDEAYYEYIYGKDFYETINYVKEERKNIIVLRTFSKMYSLAGLRVGYGIANPKIIELINRVRNPFNVTSIAQLAAAESLKDKKMVDLVRNKNFKAIEYFKLNLKELNLKYVDTAANFMLIDVKKDSNETFIELLKENIIIRPMKGYKLDTLIRVSFGTEEQNKFFFEKLKKVLKI